MCGGDGMPVVCCEWRWRVQRQEQVLQRWIHADDDVRSRAAAANDCTSTVASGDAASAGSDSASADAAAANACAADAAAADARAADACAADACAADSCAIDSCDRLRGRNDARCLRDHVVWECHTDQVLFVESSHWKVRRWLRYVLQSGESRSYAQENSF
jgi:hypothetical protein